MQHLLSKNREEKTNIVIACNSGLFANPPRFLKLYSNELPPRFGAMNGSCDTTLPSTPRSPRLWVVKLASGQLIAAAAMTTTSAIHCPLVDQQLHRHQRR